MEFKIQVIVRKTIMAVFLFINAILTIFFMSQPFLMRFTNTCYLMGDFVTREKILLGVIIFILEIFTIPSLFASKSKYKLIGNIILHIMCIVDIGFCISLITENVDLSQMIIEIIIDIVFMALMIYDIIKSNKEYVDTSDEKFFKERYINKYIS